MHNQRLNQKHRNVENWSESDGTKETMLPIVSSQMLYTKFVITKFHFSAPEQCRFTMTNPQDCQSAEYAPLVDELKVRLYECVSEK